MLLLLIFFLKFNSKSRNSNYNKTKLKKLSILFAALCIFLIVCLIYKQKTNEEITTITNKPKTGKENNDVKNITTNTPPADTFNGDKKAFFQYLNNNHKEIFKIAELEHDYKAKKQSVTHFNVIHRFKNGLIVERLIINTNTGERHIITFERPNSSDGLLLIITHHNPCFMENIIDKEYYYKTDKEEEFREKILNIDLKESIAYYLSDRIKVSLKFKAVYLTPLSRYDMQKQNFLYDRFEVICHSKK